MATTTAAAANAALELEAEEQEQEQREQIPPPTTRPLLIAAPSEMSMSLATTTDARVRALQRRLANRARLVASDGNAFRARDGTVANHLESRQSPEEYQAVGNWGRCLPWLNVEPVLLVFAIALGILVTSQQLFLYYARCVEIVQKTSPGADAESICARLHVDNDTRLVNEVESDIATAKIYIQIANSIPTIVSAPLIGTWSDRSGRKKPLLLTLFGFLLYSTAQLVATLTFKSTNVYLLIGLGEFLMGCVGGMCSVFATIFAITTDNSRDQLKPGVSSVPLRIGVASCFQSFGMMLGTLLVSALSPSDSDTDPASHMAAYQEQSFAQTLFCGVALLSAALCVRESHRRTDIAAPDDRETEESSCCRTLAGHYKSIYQVLSTKRPGWTRVCLNLAFVFAFFEFLAVDNSLLVLLVKRPPFSWSDADFSNYQLLKGFLLALSMVAWPLLMRRINLVGKDSLLIVMAIAASAISFFMVSLAKDSWHIVLAVFLVLVAGAVSPAYRSFLPRMVTQQETARLFTVVALVMAVCPMVASAVFNTIFQRTVNTWPGAAFAVGGALQLVVVFGQLMVHVLMLPQWRSERDKLAAVERLEEDESAPDTPTAENNRNNHPGGPSSSTETAGTSSSSTVSSTSAVRDMKKPSRMTDV